MPRLKTDNAAQTYSIEWETGWRAGLRSRLSSLMLLCSCVLLAAAAKPPPSPPPTVGVAFSGAFTDYAVLQRATETTSLVAVYGFCGAVGNQLSSNLVTGVCTYKAGASVEVTLEGFPPVTSPIGADGSWKAMLPAQPAGGTFSLSAACTTGCASSSATTLQNLTFGDVTFCSGGYLTSVPTSVPLLS